MISSSILVTGQSVPAKKTILVKKVNKKSKKIKNDSIKNPSRLIKTEIGYYCPPCGKG